MSETQNVETTENTNESAAPTQVDDAKVQEALAEYYARVSAIEGTEEPEEPVGAEEGQGRVSIFNDQVPQQTTGVETDHPAAVALEDARQGFTQATTQLMFRYKDRIREIKDMDGSDEQSPLWGRISDEERAEILATRRREVADQLYKDTVQEFERHIDAHAARYDEAAEALRSELFDVNEDQGDQLARAVVAPEDNLIAMLGLAKLTGNMQLQKVAFAAAISRDDCPRVVANYLAAYPQKERLLHLWESVPVSGEEWAAEQRAKLAQIVRPVTPDQLRTHARGTT